MMAEFVSYPQRPLTPNELLRIGAAMLPFGLPFGDGYDNNEIWVVMETDLPNKLIGIVASREAATQLLASRGGNAPPADIYGPYAPPSAATAYLDETDPCIHDDTQMRRPGTSLGDLRLIHRKQADTIGITLQIRWAPRGNLPTHVEIEVDPRADTIFLTRASREAFAYPRYLTLLGPAYLAALRQTLGEQAP